MKINTPLFILEMANNHMGDVTHGVSIIQKFGEVCRKHPDFNFAFKLQYRDIDTFIHPSARGRDDIKYVKRFSETRLLRPDFDRLVAEMRAQGFLTMATPFDEPSVGVIEEQNLDIIKVASCSFTDWPLLERIASSKKPVIASTAGADLEEIDKVVSFLLHRNKDFAILHCVGEYPTPEEHTNLSQINFLKARYPGVKVGFSTHEDPNNTDIIKLAVAKGAEIFEKHVGLPTLQHPLNAYSANPMQLDAWLEGAKSAMILNGTGEMRPLPNMAEQASLKSLRRGVFARRKIAPGETIHDKDVYFAFPPDEDQFTANDWSKYNVFSAKKEIDIDAPLSTKNVERDDVRAKIRDIAQRVKQLLAESKIAVPGGVDLEISHHYGLAKFDEFGLVMLTLVNRGYCKKLLVLLPGQNHPEQYHKEKEETFHVLHGEVQLTLNDVKEIHRAGSVVTIEPGVRHSFFSEVGSVVEEISSTHFKNDSFYTDEMIQKNTARKTLLTYWME